MLPPLCPVPYATLWTELMSCVMEPAGSASLFYLPTTDYKEVFNIDKRGKKFGPKNQIR
jgi:hypothetical protein